MTPTCPLCLYTEASEFQQKDFFRCPHCHLIFKDLQNDVVNYSSNFMRLWNEGATLILFAVVFLVILKNAFNWIYGVIGIVLFSVLIMLGFKFYKRIREKKN